LAVHLSTKKNLRQSRRANLRNRMIKTEFKTLIKKVKTSPDQKQAQADFKKVTSLLDKASKSKVIHKNKASRIKSRLSKALSSKKPA